ncbi:hypothetical protein QFC20_003599 [Naganishia adeliensis]|uniref:Uncharacterized protein n=1 Tax=Naganishia adeliensis TaxID=92952 RepID=A0ACC2WAA8_9TREE|nr:hypothetical protein QFC20_003599 [Naganishia adeliensis]
MKFYSVASLLSVASVAFSPIAQESPWVLGKDNAVTWSMGGDLGITEFDIQLHNFNKSVMVGFLQLAQNVPVQKWASGSKKGQYGGELSVDLPQNMATGDGFSLIFMNTKSGNVYYKTPKFPIYAAASQPSNYSAPVLPSGTPATTAVITDMPNPTQQWGVTVGPAVATVTVADQAGHAGSGGSG